MNRMNKMDQIRVGVIGAEGRMGKLIIYQLQQSSRFVLERVFTHPDSPNLGNRMHLVHPDVNFEGVLESSAVLLENPLSINLDIMIDFSIANATESLVPNVVSHQIPVLSGTTGLNTCFRDVLPTLCQKHTTSCFIAANFSIGINIVKQILRNFALVLNNWNCEIVEEHHMQKVDKPSGTALDLKDLLIQYTDPSQNTVQEIPIHSIRLGNIVGNHELAFANGNEMIRIGHSVQNRAVFAEGALQALHFLIDNADTGKVLGMTDFINHQFQTINSQSNGGVTGHV